jgi:hypothetical protein
MYIINSDQEVKMFWFKLCQKDLFQFKGLDSNRYEDMYHLSGPFITEGDIVLIKNVVYYGIDIVNLKGKTLKFYLNNKVDLKNWMRAFNGEVLDDYEFKVKNIYQGNYKTI